MGYICLFYNKKIRKTKSRQKKKTYKLCVVMFDGTAIINLANSGSGHASGYLMTSTNGSQTISNTGSTVVQITNPTTTTSPQIDNFQQSLPSSPSYMMSNTCSLLGLESIAQENPKIAQQLQTYTEIRTDEGIHKAWACIRGRGCNGPHAFAIGTGMSTNGGIGNSGYASSNTIGGGACERLIGQTVHNYTTGDQPLIIDVRYPTNTFLVNDFNPKVIAKVSETITSDISAQNIGDSSSNYSCNVAWPERMGGPRTHNGTSCSELIGANIIPSGSTPNGLSLFEGPINVISYDASASLLRVSYSDTVTKEFDTMQPSNGVNAFTCTIQWTSGPQTYSIPTLGSSLKNSVNASPQFLAQVTRIEQTYGNAIRNALRMCREATCAENRDRCTYIDPTQCMIMMLDDMSIVDPEQQKVLQYIVDSVVNTENFACSPNLSSCIPKERPHLPPLPRPLPSPPLDIIVLPPKAIPTPLPPPAKQPLYTSLLFWVAFIIILGMIALVAYFAYRMFMKRKKSSTKQLQTLQIK